MRPVLAAFLAVALAHSAAPADLCDHCVDYGSDPVEPILGTLDVTDDPFDLELRGNRVYMITNNTYLPEEPRANDLVIVDVTDPTAPVQLGVLDSPWGRFSLDVEGDHAYVANPSLAKIDVSDPTDPRLVGSFDFGQFPGETAKKLDVDGAYAYVIVDVNGAGGDRIRIFDVSGSDLVPVGIVEFPYWMNDLVVRGTHMFGAGAGGFWVVDVTDPAQPAIVENVLLANQATGVDLTGEIAVVSVFTTPSAIFDISDPAAPVLIGEGPGVAEFALSGDLLYYPLGSGLRVVDLSDPAYPTVVGTASGLYAFFLDVEGCRLATVNPFLGDELRMVAVHCAVPASTAEGDDLDGAGERIRSVPNPAPIGTPIALRLPGPEWNDIGIHNASGRVVRRVAAPLPGDPISWDGRDDLGRRVESGVYFVRARSRSATAIGKVTICE